MSVARLLPLSRRAFRQISVSTILHSRSTALQYLGPSSLRFSRIHTSPSHFQNLQPSSAARPCPACSKPLTSYVPACTNCWNIFSLSPDMTHHELFGLPYEPNPFVVDLSALKQRFRQAQAVCHPDMWAAKGLDKQDLAQALSSRVNEAYQALLRPLARAEYILGRNNLPISEDDQVDDTAFVIEIMEARELIDDAEEAAEVISLMEENDDKINETVHHLEKLVGQKDWVSVKAAAIRLRYLEGIARAAKKWLDNH